MHLYLYKSKWRQRFVKLETIITQNADNNQSNADNAFSQKGDKNFVKKKCDNRPTFKSQNGEIQYLVLKTDDGA